MEPMSNTKEYITVTQKLDYKKQFKDLYLPKRKPMLVDVPAMQFIMVDGRGAPGGVRYQKAIQVLYSLSFTIKMSKMGSHVPDGYFEYVVPPLEGLWWCAGGGLDWALPKSEWCWTSMIRQPEFVTPELFGWAIHECRKKRPDVDVSQVRLETFSEGLCVQMLHVGSYDEESRSVASLKEFMNAHQLSDQSGPVRKHHEVYLSDPRRTAAEKLKTVLRLPVEKA